MTRVETQMTIDAPADLLGNEVFRVEMFPQYMENVKDVRIIERDKDRQISSWRVEIDGVELRWTEEDILDLSSGRMAYKLLEGDFACFEGVWVFNGNFRSTKVSLTVDYDLGLPAFEEILGEILEKKIRKNSQDLLHALRRRVEEPI